MTSWFILFGSKDQSTSTSSVKSIKDIDFNKNFTCLYSYMACFGYSRNGMLWSVWVFCFKSRVACLLL